MFAMFAKAWKLILCRASTRVPKIKLYRLYRFHVTMETQANVSKALIKIKKEAHLFISLNINPPQSQRTLGGREI